VGRRLWHLVVGWRLRLEAAVEATQERAHTTDEAEYLEQRYAVVVDVFMQTGQLTIWNISMLIIMDAFMQTV
jgi:hypothetical protein